MWNNWYKVFIYFNKFFKVIYKNIAYKYTIFVSDDLWINNKIYLFA
jgi:hypothetical protein